MVMAVTRLFTYLSDQFGTTDVAEAFFGAGGPAGHAAYVALFELLSRDTPPGRRGVLVALTGRGRGRGRGRGVRFGRDAAGAGGGVHGGVLGRVGVLAQLAVGGPAFAERRECAGRAAGGRPFPAAVRAGLARRGFRLTGGLAEGVARVLQVVQALGMDRAWVVMVRWALLADELGRGGGHSAVEVLGASQRPGVGVRAEDEPLVADLDAAGLRAWAGAGPFGGGAPFGGAGPAGGAPGGGAASPGGGGAPGGAQRWGGGVRGPGPGVPGLGAAVPAGPGAHGVYVPRGDGPADHLAGRALRTFPGAFTVAAHLAQVSPGGPPGGALWWAGQRVTAAQFAGVVGRLPGYREARALNGGQPPVLVLVICEAAAAGARSFAAVVDRLYPGPVVAATSALLQPGRWRGRRWWPRTAAGSSTRARAGAGWAAS